MSPPSASAKITLTYPLYAADFDPRNNDFLLVGGGGGEGRSGVGNKITLLDTSRKHQLSEVVDINLSRDEDSVTSLAYAQSTDLWATAYAGINSSMAEQNKGKNEHLRSFLLQYPARQKLGIADSDAEQEKDLEQKGETKALGAASLFTPNTATKKETFQRVLKLSKKGTGPRLGAVATGLAPEGEIVVFAADTARPAITDVRGRINLGKEEAADVDIVGLESEGDYRLAFCTDYEVHVTSVNYSYNRTEQLQSVCIHKIPQTDPDSPKPRPRYRCIRFLTPNLFVLLQNVPNGQGSELLVMELSGGIITRKRLHKKIKSATALSVAALPFTTSKHGPQFQHAVAVAGADTSITILTLNHVTAPPYGRPKFQLHLFLPAVHPTSITSLTFSTYHPPTTSSSTTPTQYLKLASTSIANTCIVHTLPLSPYQTPRKDEDSITSYILATASPKSSTTRTLFSALVALIAIALGAFFLQAFTEIRGGVPETLGAKHWLSERWQGWIAQPYMSEENRIPIPSAISTSIPQATGAATEQESLSAASVAIESDISAMSSAVEGIPPAASAAMESTKGGLRDLLARRKPSFSSASSSESDNHVLVISHNLPSAENDPDDNPKSSLTGRLLHPSSLFPHLEEQRLNKIDTKRWEDMGMREKEVWKQRLVDAGEWTVDEGEAVFKGVLFSGLARAVGGVVGAG